MAGIGSEEEYRTSASGVCEASLQMPNTKCQMSNTTACSFWKDFSKSNSLATDVEGLILELELTDRVMLLGFVPDEDLPALYRGAIFFVYPSLYEGFGLPTRSDVAGDTGHRVEHLLAPGSLW